MKHFTDELIADTLQDNEELTELFGFGPKEKYIRCIVAICKPDQTTTDYAIDCIYRNIEKSLENYREISDLVTFNPDEVHNSALDCLNVNKNTAKYAFEFTCKADRFDAILARIQSCALSDFRNMPTNTARTDFYLKLPKILHSGIIGDAKKPKKTREALEAELEDWYTQEL